jgi:hypothetical protein
MIIQHELSCANYIRRLFNVVLAWLNKNEDNENLDKKDCFPRFKIPELKFFPIQDYVAPKLNSNI